MPYIHRDAVDPHDNRSVAQNGAHSSTSGVERVEYARNKCSVAIRRSWFKRLRMPVGWRLRLRGNLGGRGATVRAPGASPVTGGVAEASEPVRWLAPTVLNRYVG